MRRNLMSVNQTFFKIAQQRCAFGQQEEGLRILGVDNLQELEKRI